MHWRRTWQPTPVFLPGESHGWRSLVSYSPWGRKESGTTERLRFHFTLTYSLQGASQVINGKEPACQCKRPKRSGFDPWVRKIPWRRAWQTHSSILAWRIPWTEEPGGLQSTGSQRTGHDWSDLAYTLELASCKNIWPKDVSIYTHPVPKLKPFNQQLSIIILKLWLTAEWFLILKFNTKVSTWRKYKWLFVLRDLNFLSNPQVWQFKPTVVS